MPMIAITTSNSISVKAERLLRRDIVSNPKGEERHRARVLRSEEL
jgi:hypothetical protein